MNRRNLAVLAGLFAAFALGRALSGAPDPPLLPAGALADPALAVSDGQRFVSTDGGSAYLWRVNGDRLELVGHAQRLVAEPGNPQAPFVWLPGVERRN